jgi:hypothetical protein
MKVSELKEIIREELEKLKEERRHDPETHSWYVYARLLYKKHKDGLSTKYPHTEFVKALVDVMKATGKSKTQIGFYMNGEDFLSDELESYSDYVKFKKETKK